MDDAYCYWLLRNHCADARLRLADATLFADYRLTDFALAAQGTDLDRLYALNPQLRNTVRRGNTFVQVLATKSRDDYFFVGRRGLPKLFDLRLEYLQFNTRRLKQLPFRGEELKVHDQLLHSMFQPVSEAVSAERKMRIFQLEKFDGQNVQVSWSFDLGMWIVCSQKVAMLVLRVEDVADSQYKGQRYQQASQFALEWLSEVDRLKQKHGPDLIKELKEFLDRHTFVGEYVGHPDFQHIVRYKKTKIVWFAVVSNTEQRQLCLPVLDARDVFKKFDLNFANIVRRQNFSSWNDLNKHLQQSLKLTAEGPIERTGQGIVAYVEQQRLGKQQVISIFKLKNLQYRLFRKIRELLSSFCKSYEQSLDSGTDLQTESSRVEDYFCRQAEELCQSHEARPPFPLSSYRLVLGQLLQFAKHNRLQQKYLRGHFIDLLDVAHYSLSVQKHISSAMLKDKGLIQRLRKVEWLEYGGFEHRFVFIVPLLLPATGTRLTGRMLAQSSSRVSVISSQQILSQLLAKREDSKRQTVVESLRQLSRKKANQRLAALLKQGFSETDQLKRFVYWDESTTPRGLEELKTRLQKLCLQHFCSYEIHTVVPSCATYFDSNRYCFSACQLALAVLRITSQEYLQHHSSLAPFDQVRRARTVLSAALDFRGYEQRDEKLHKGRVHYLKQSNSLEVGRLAKFQESALRVISRLKQENPETDQHIRQLIDLAREKFSVQELGLTQTQRRKQVACLLSSLTDPTFGLPQKKTISFNVEQKGDGLEDLSSVLYFSIGLGRKQVEECIIDDLPSKYLNGTTLLNNFHITTLYCKGSKIQLLEEHPVVRLFRQDEIHRVYVEWVVVLFETIVVAVVAGKVLSDNRHPHITLALGKGVKAAQANDLLTELGEGRWVHREERKVRFRGESRTALMWQLERRAELEGRAAAVRRRGGRR